MNYASQDLLGIFLVFCRAAGIFFLVPPFADKAVNSYIRIIIAFSLSLFFYQGEVMGPLMASLLSDPLLLSFTLMIEIFTGLALALFIKILLSASQVAGMTIATQIGLNSGAFFDASQGTNNSTIGILLSFLTTVLMLETGLSAKILSGIYSSYDTIPIGVIKNFDKMIFGSVSKMWNFGLQLSLPFILINLIMMIGAGILAKLMPQMQIFFLLLPVQIIIGFLLLIATIAGMLLYFGEFLQGEIGQIF